MRIIEKLKSGKWLALDHFQDSCEEGHWLYGIGNTEKEAIKDFLRQNGRPFKLSQQLDNQL